MDENFIRQYTAASPFDRLPVIGFEGWTETLVRCRTEGLGEGVDPNQALEQECVRRFKTAWDLGRYVPALDHLAPPDISWESAQRYARIVREGSSGPNGLS